MGKARYTGRIWSDVFGPHGGRAKALLVALPFLLLSLMIDHGAGAGNAMPGSTIDSARQATDFRRVADTEGKAQRPGRATQLTTDPQVLKSNFSSNGAGGLHGVAPIAGMPLHTVAAALPAGAARSSPPTFWPVASQPRAPPARLA